MGHTSKGREGEERRGREEGAKRKGRVARRRERTVAPPIGESGSANDCGHRHPSVFLSVCLPVCVSVCTTACPNAASAQP